MSLPLLASPPAPRLGKVFAAAPRASRGGGGGRREFPSFLPPEVERVSDRAAREMAMRIERVPVQTSFSRSPILSSCVKPRQQNSKEPLILLHGFDSSCLEWRYIYPLLEDAGLEAWAVDILGWGFSDLETLPRCDVAAKCEHLYQLWKSHIKRPMVLVGASLGAAVAIDFAANHPQAVAKLIFIDASVYAEGTGGLSKLPKVIAYAGLSLLRSFPLRACALRLSYDKIPEGARFDWVNIASLHCRFPWWKDATFDFMMSGGYNVINQIKDIKQPCLIVWGEDDRIVNFKLAYRLCHDLDSSVLRMVSQCGHIPHVEKPDVVTKHIIDFLDKDKTDMLLNGVTSRQPQLIGDDLTSYTRLPIPK